MEEQPKSGKEFEELVTWVHKCLHEKAVITPNDKIRDNHSNRLRQIDISIRMKDGPTNFLGIVEVRDRSRPVGEDYIEQISTKRHSVGADAAFIISSSGFYQAAVEKARALNIRIFTHKEAIASDWMQCLQLKKITSFIRKWDNVLITFIDPATNHIINPHQSVANAVKENAVALVFVTEQKEPRRSVPDVVSMAINQNIENIFGGITIGNRQRKRAFVNLLIPQNESPLFFCDSAGVLRRLERFCFEADFWTEVHRSPVRLAKYSNAETGEALAEIASTTIEAWGKPHKLDLIAKISGEGSQVLMRLQKLDEPKTK
ncbi:MAG TPA: restriction endonuclease [Verrucomicrobiae bacterium]|nr:restriction endonuclease [Verrucomicrobiae bacterium]